LQKEFKGESISIMGVELNVADALTSLGPVQEKVMDRLQELKDNGFGRVKIITRGDAEVCDVCRKRNGEIMSFEKAAEVEAERHEGCRCKWLGVPGQ
jgi:hypothetical protein